ncbi:hypothetical protein O181_119288, partial [Austropuccinia psidii MF-1]|nr:hypothetical protein [Austropuccinia psidii MF-1]
YQQLYMFLDWAIAFFQTFSTLYRQKNMNSLYTLALRQVTSLQNELSERERNLTTSLALPSNAASLHGQIAASFSSLQRTLDVLKSNLNKLRPLSAVSYTKKAAISCQCPRFFAGDNSVY